MSKEKIKEAVRAAGFLGAFMDMLVRAVVNAGGSLQNIHACTTPGGAETLRKVAEMIAQGFRGMVTYAMSIADSIKAGDYTWAANVPENLFPTQVHEKGTDEVVYSYVEARTLREAWDKMEQSGKRPPTARETLAFGEQFPDEQRKHPIIGAASAPDAYGVVRLLILCEL